MLDMLRITAQAVNNTVIGAGIDRAAEKVKGGKSLSSSLKTEEYILPFVPQMINIGEQSGKVDEMMGKAAQVYEEELDEEIKSISTAIEPISDGCARCCSRWSSWCYFVPNLWSSQ